MHEKARLFRFAVVFFFDFFKILIDFFFIQCYTK